MNKKRLENEFLKLLMTLLIAWVAYHAGSEFYNVAWGTGKWRGEFSLTWAMLYYVFAAFCVLLFGFAVLFIWNNKLFTPAVDRIVSVREKLGGFRWLLALFVLMAPVWFFQYTSWGFVFQKLYIRIFIWIITVCLLTVLSSRRNQLAGWNEFLASLVLTVSSFSIAVSLKEVNNYPFSLGWSEGNRLWDYSIMFGRERYIYPTDKNIPVLLDFGRRLVGGLPFIIPGINITIARLWVGLTLIIPYLLLGFAVFRKSAGNKALWLLLTLWTFLFLKQGPIHPPLVLSAALVALAWQSPLWVAIPLVMGAGYFAETSRFTWLFAPGIWIFMLEFSSISFAPLADRKSLSAIWKRAIILGVLGIFGGFILPNLLDSAKVLVSSQAAAATPIATAIVQPPVMTATPAPATAEPDSTPKFIAQVVQVITIQPLLWYRLLPNSTYGNGILLALLFAITPLLIILIYLSAKKFWSLERLQKLVLILPSLAFLGVGLVASTKIGGGGDLHNMDMFLIGLFFTGTLAWYNGGSDWVQDSKAIPALMKIMVVALLANSFASPLLGMRSYGFGEDTFHLKILSDAPREIDLGMLPAQAEVDSAIQFIQEETTRANSQGEVLFMDQRQLLTFGYITGIPLVPEYEKKVLMNQALSEDAAYFNKFHKDLAAHRFSLIVSEPLRTPIKDSSFQFGEENNAWVKWVAAPILCYYEPLETIKTVNVQLLVPNQNTADCPAVLP